MMDKGDGYISLETKHFPHEENLEREAWAVRLTIMSANPATAQEIYQSLVAWANGQFKCDLEKDGLTSGPLH